MGKKTIRDARVKEVEKRRYPTKHYVYVLEVSWSEGSSITVFRRYSDFFEFQILLLEKFPLEGGVKDPTQRMIPFLPGKKLFGRSNIRTVAEKRKEKIDEYCRTLIRLPSKISDSEYVQDFFEIRQTDLEKPKKPKAVKGQPKINEISDPLILERYVAIADYEKQKKNECTLMAGQTVEVIDKNENGWWFVNVDDFHEGWVPATYLDPLYGTEDTAVQRLDPGEEETWIAMNRYEAQHHDEIGFEKGVLVEVFEKGIDGWWKVRYQDKEGMVPAAYLRRYDGQGVGLASTGVEIVSTLKDATVANDKKSLVKSTPAKPAQSSLSSSMTVNPQKTLSNPSGLRSPTFSSPSVALNSSLTSSGPTTTSPTQLSPTPKSPLGGTPEGSQSADRTTPSPSPKPVNVMALAAAVAAEKQTFAPSWHSRAKPHVDEEPIYGPTPRRCSFKKPLLKKREMSSFSSSSIPEPVYEIIPEPEVEVYMTIAEFSAEAGDSVNFQAGMSCTVVTKNANGWWYVDMDGEEGWVPSSYLEKVSGGSADSANMKPPANPSVPSQPYREKSAAKVEPKLAVVKSEPVKEVKRKEPPVHQRNETPSVQPRKTFSSSTSNSNVKKSSLRRSTSTDSGLNEDIDGNKPKVTPMRSPSSVRKNAAPPRPSRPKVSPTIPNGPKSPRTGSTTSLRPVISGPMALQVSPAARRKSEAPSSSRPAVISKFSNNSDITAKTIKTSPAVKRPPPMKQRSNEDVSSSSRTTTSHKKQSSPELHVGTLRSGDHGGGDRWPTATSRPSISHTRRGSNSTPSGTNYKSELERKLFAKSTTQATSSSSVPAQQPKRPSPPNRPKAPSIKSTSGGTQKSDAPPGRPQPPKVGPAKRPPPPVVRLSAAPKPKTPLYITVATYSSSGDDSCLSFDEGAEVEVIEKNNDGWWFVKINNEEGWAPSTYIEERKGGGGGVSPGPNRPSRPKPAVIAKPSVEAERQPELPVNDGDASIPKPKPRPRLRKTTTTFCRATDSYDIEGDDDSELQLVKGRVYELKEKSDSGWWLMKDGDIEGWAPSNYLQQQ